MSVVQQAGFVQTEPELLDQMIRASQARPGDAIKIVGQGTMSLLLGLCRRGFAKVSCCAADRGPRAGDAPVDRLWLLDIASDEQLLGALSRFGRGLGANGQILIEDRRPMLHGRVGSLRVLLARHGFSLERLGSAGAPGSMLLAIRRRLTVQAHPVQHAA